MIWATAGCDDDVYANISSGAWPGCVASGDGRLACSLDPRPGCCHLC